MTISVIRSAFLAGLGEGGVELGQHVLGARRIEVEAVPAGAELHRAPEGLVGIAADDDRHMRLLDRLGIHLHRLERHPLALEVDHRLGPQAAHHLEELVAARAAVLPLVAAALDLFLVPADADAEIEAAVGQPVERADFLGGVDRVALGDERDAGAEAHLGRGRGEEAEGRRDVEHAAARRHRDAAILRARIAEGVLVEQGDMLAHPDRFEARDPRRACRSP